ncbi:uncharacterized protein [Haliotis asinina]|uniref:uncharacterized protein n=1 Tax=Haliotis asinina TaxID=109174 RepID=UPI003531C457
MVRVLLAGEWRISLDQWSGESNSATILPTTPTHQHSKSVDVSPVTETRSLDFKSPSCPRPDIGKALDDIIAKTLGTDLTTKSINNDRQSALEKKTPSTPAKVPNRVFTSIEKRVTTLENQGKMSARPVSRNLNPESIVLTEKWYLEHLNNPYPTQTEAEDIANKGGIPVSPSFPPRTIPSPSSSSLPILPESNSATILPTTPTHQHSKSVDVSPVTETRSLDFKSPSCPRPDIGKALDDIIAKTLGTDLTTKSINNDRQSALENRLQALQPRFPTEVKELSSFLAFHSSSIQKEHQQCLQDGFFPTDYHNWLTNRYSDQLHLVFTSIEKRVTTLENQGKMSARPVSRNLNPESIVLMEKWYLEHLNNPYPTQTEAEDIANKGGISLSQVRKWFSNKRHRTRKPRSVKAVVAAKQCEEFLSGILQM